MNRIVTVVTILALIGMAFFTTLMRKFNNVDPDRRGGLILANQGFRGKSSVIVTNPRGLFAYTPADFKNIAYLRFENTKVEFEEINFAVSLVNPSHVEFRNCQIFGYGFMTSETVRGITLIDTSVELDSNDRVRLPNLTTLSIHGSSDSFLSVLSKITSLESLKLSGLSNTEHIGTFLKDLKTIGRVEIVNCSIANTLMQSISIPKIDFLILDGTLVREGENGR